MSFKSFNLLLQLILIMLCNLINFFKLSFNKPNQRLFQKLKITNNGDKQKFKYQRPRKQHYEIDGKKKQGFQKPYKPYKGQKYTQDQYKFKEHGQRFQRFPQSSHSPKGINFGSTQQNFETSTKLQQQNLKEDAIYQSMQIDWHAISQPCPEQIKQIIMLQEQKDFHKNQKIKLKVIKAFRTIFQASKNRNLSCYSCLVLLIFLKYSKIQQLRFFHRNVVSIFTLRYTSSNKQNFIELMKQLNHKNLHRQGQGSKNWPIRGARSPKIAQFLVCQLVNSIQNCLVLTFNKSKKFRLKSHLYQILNDLCEIDMGMKAIKNIAVILSNKILDRSYIHDRFKITYFVKKLQQKLINIIKEDKHLSQNVKTHQLSIIVSVLKCVQFSMHYSKQNEKFFVNLICSNNFLPPSLSQTAKVHNYFTFYRYFSVYLDDNNKNPILERIKQFYLESRNSQIKGNVKKTYVIITLISMIKAKFYNHYIRIPTKIINQFLVIDQPITKPEFDEFAIRFLLENKQLIMSCDIAILEIIHKIYPNVIKQAQIFKSLQQYKQQKYYQVQTENQLTYRIKLAIKLLNIPYKQEVKIGGKKCDFLLELSDSKVILQCDGDTHIDFRRMNVTIDTAWRNMVFMLFGYRIIVINFFQFNQCRFINQIAQIISNKLKILQQHQAYLVS